MIIIRKRHVFTEGQRPKNWFDYILDHLNSDIAFDTLFNIFDGFPHAKGPLLTQAVSELKRKLPSVPNKELERYVEVWVEHHEGLLKGYG
jgi:hypothetical protein